MKVEKELLEIFKEVSKQKGSDVFFSPKNANEVGVNLRIGNKAQPIRVIEKEMYDQLLAYVRFHSKLNLTHPSYPQSGSLVITENESRLIDLRVSILPTNDFTSMALRCINLGVDKKLDEIPFFSKRAQQLRALASEKSGLILIGGPTASGKSTTAKALVDYLKNELGKSVITIEEPVEYQKPLIERDLLGNTQVSRSLKPEQKEQVVSIPQIKKSDVGGMSYEIGIREILRHDPDVIMIEEIQNAATAENAVRAALTGHLVISTIHSKDNIGSISRLSDLGIQINDLEQSLVGLVNQRLTPPEESRSALMEITKGDHLGHLLKQVKKGRITKISYETIDEEFLKWRATKGVSKTNKIEAPKKTKIRR